MYCPEILNPVPDPGFVRELKRIDPDLRVVFGYNRYFRKSWAIERLIPPDRYFTMYSSLLESGEPLVVNQPIFDTNQPVYDQYGDFVCYAQIGEREFELAPRYEWLAFYDSLDGVAMAEIKRAYAWNRNHSLTRQRIEKEQEDEIKAAKEKAKRVDIGMEGVEEAFREHRKRVIFGYGETRNER